MGINKVNNLYNIVVSSNIFHLQPELCKSVHKCNFGEFLNFRNFWTNDVTDDVIGVVGSIFWVILRVYTYDVIISKFHKNLSVNKNCTVTFLSLPLSFPARVVHHALYESVHDQLWMPSEVLGQLPPVFPSAMLWSSQLRPQQHTHLKAGLTPP